MTLLRSTLLAALLVAVGPLPARAQVGDLIDWLHKMSGPSLTTYGLKYRFPDNEPGRLLGYNPGRYLDGEVVGLLRAARAASGLARTETDNVAQCLDAAADGATARHASRQAFHETSVDLLRDDTRELTRLLSTPGAIEMRGFRSLIEDRVCDLALRLQGLAPDRTWGIRFRVSGSYGHDRENDDRERQVIRTITLQATTEGLVTFRLFGHPIALGLETGLARWYWFGDFPDFASHSVPLIGNLYPFARCKGWLLHNFRVGAGWQFFSPIDRDRFLPIEFEEVDGWEAVRHVIVGVDLSASALKGDNPAIGC